MMTAAGVEAAGSPSTGGVTSEALRLKHYVQRQRPGMDVAGARDLPDQPCVRTRSENRGQHPSRLHHSAAGYNTRV